jgi:hypothetical protein
LFGCRGHRRRFDQNARRFASAMTINWWRQCYPRSVNQASW